MSLWNKASEIGNKLKMTWNNDNNIDKKMFDDLKNEYEKLSNDFKDKNKKYDDLVNEVYSKKDKNESEIQKDYDNLNSTFREFLIKLFNNYKDYKDKIDLTFVNTNPENLNKLLGEIPKELNDKFIKELVYENRETFNILMENDEEDMKKIEDNDSDEEDKANEDSDNNNNNIDNNNNNIDNNNNNNNQSKENNEQDINNNKSNDNNKNLNTKKNQKRKTSFDYTKIDSKELFISLLYSLKMKYLNYKETIRLNRSKLITFNQKMKVLNKNISQLQNDGLSKDSKLKNINENLEQKDELLNSKNDMIKELTTIIENHEKEIKKNEGLIKELQVKLENFDKNIEQNSESYKKLKEENEGYKSTIEKLEAELNESKLLKDKNQSLYLIVKENEQTIKELNCQITNLKESFQICDEDKQKLIKEKNEEVEIFKQKILELNSQIENLQNININNNSNNNKNYNSNEIEETYINKINILQDEKAKIEKEKVDLLNINEELQKKYNKINMQLIKMNKDNEYMIDKRVISSVLVNYFDQSSSDLTKMNLLETLSSIMDYSNEDRIKMGLNPITIKNQNDNNNNNNINKINNNENGNLKSISEGLYDFILNS